MTKKTKVVYVLSMLSYGGTEGFVINVIKRLNLNKYDVSVILALEAKETQFCDRADELEQMGIKMYYVGKPNKNKLGFRSFCKRLRTCLVLNGPFDIIHSNMDFFNGVVLTVARKTHIPKRVAHAHISSSQTELCASFVKKVIIKIYRFIMRKMILFSATDLCGCSNEANLFEYGKKKFKDAKCIYNGISLEKYKKTIRSKSYMQDEFGVNKKYVILTVGRVANMKNPWFMVETMYQLSKLRNDFMFLWVGHNAYLESFKKAVQEKEITEHFIFAGTRNDIAEIMKNSDLFILPSIFEGLGIVLIEAQASGLHCLVSDKVPQLADCGNCEFLDIDDSDAAKKWAIRISEVLENNINYLGDEKRMQNFDIDYTIKQLTKIYGETGER